MAAKNKYQHTYQSWSGCDMVATIEMEIPGVGVMSNVLGELQTLSYSTHQEKAPIRTLGNINAKEYVFGQRTVAGSLVFAVFNHHWAKEFLDKAKESPTYAGNKILADELPAFNVTISMGNEYGQSARKAILGIQLVNEGMTLSTNDVFVENTFQFVARDIEYLQDTTEATQERIQKAADKAKAEYVPTPQEKLKAQQEQAAQRLNRASALGSIIRTITAKNGIISLR